MKHVQLISLSLAIGTLALAACDRNKNAPNSPQDRPPIVNSDATPPARSDAAGTVVNPNADSSAPSIARTDPTLAPTTGDSVPGTGDTRSATKVVDDGWITTKTKAALLAEPDLKAGDIKVETRRGTVMLSGTVSSAAHSDKASTVARGIEGVTRVENHLTVK